MADLLLTGIGQLVTNQGPDLLGLVADAAVLVRGDRVEWTGPRAAAPASDAPVLDCGGRAVLPGFVDAHTHLIFGGDRADEFARRLRGEPYEEILAAGGGILATVRATRAAGSDELLAAARQRARRMLAAGTTTVEVKSGYGLDVATELRMLEVAAELGRTEPIDVVPTLLGAHVVPEEYRGDRAGYVDLVADAMIPAAAPLARYCDVFCDPNAFTPEETAALLGVARRYGLGGRVHADQLGPIGAARVAAEAGAASADHLDHVTAEDAARLAAAGTVAVLLPAASFAMRAAHAPARLLWDAGVTVALATDCNPGTSYTEGMGLVIALAALEMGLTPEEAVWAATRGGALAVEDADKGRIGPGARADMVVLDAPSYLHLPYRPATNLAWKVVKDGEVVAG